MTSDAFEPAVIDDRFAAALRGFGPIGILAVLIILAGNAVIVPLGAVLVLVWARLSRTPWRELGYAKPRSWIGSLVIGIAFGIAFKFLMKMIVMPLLGADPINHAYHYLAGNKAAIPATLFAVIVGAGFGEETMFRGYMFERLGKLFGSRVPAKAAIVMRCKESMTPPLASCLSRPLGACYSDLCHTHASATSTSIMT